MAADRINQATTTNFPPFGWAAVSKNLPTPCRPISDETGVCGRELMLAENSADHYATSHPLPYTLFCLDVLKTRRIRLTDISHCYALCLCGRGTCSHEAETTLPGVGRPCVESSVIDRRLAKFSAHCFLFLMPRTNLFTFPLVHLLPLFSFHIFHFVRTVA